MGQPWPLFHLFSSFQTNIKQFSQQTYVKKFPSSKWGRDSNPQPSEHECPPITTRPGLPIYYTEDTKVCVSVYLPKC